MHLLHLQRSGRKLLQVSLHSSLTLPTSICYMIHQLIDFSLVRASLAHRHHGNLLLFF